ncbi:amidohydrolase family protein [Rhodococcus pyridinivorans]|uniref:amidohydrolase family protein n=1 Tax=Rhodococcus TaxID=1827 RepID=UPI001C5891FE|nr:MULTISPECIES: amidohydrolase family protein [Rhodococcus]QXU52504.1 amidohydrolase family protein [Rhodococcus sp. LW-XY12]UVT24631.1 amidohydrolase family protein [Rhodococcus pyridinivorans]
MRVADGPDRVLAAVREQLKKGASQIKVMVGGGAASMYDPLYTVQFTDPELRAAVHAATDYGTYVATHVYNVTGIRRAVAAGVKSIEHGHLADEETIALLAEKDVWLSMQPFALGDHHYPDPNRADKDKEICSGTTTYTSGRASTASRPHGALISCSNLSLRTGRVRWQHASAITTATPTPSGCSPRATPNCSGSPASEIRTGRPRSG